MITTIVILSIVVLICFFTIGNLLRKIEKVDDELTSVSVDVEEFINNLKAVQNKISEIDSKGMFESDDEVGTVFTGIRDIILSFDTKYNNKEKQDNE
tara:strand:+ start:341 stop:631 length:291 start_codon:yes stop_codon:yes gene_type:complete